MAGGEGFEPPHTDPESAVLPLDEPPKLRARFYHVTIKTSSELSVLIIFLMRQGSEVSVDYYLPYPKE